MSLYQEEYKDLKVKLDGHLLWVTLNNPSMSNAISDDMINSLCLLLDRADTDRDVRVIVLTGEGKSFCAGGDIKAMKAKSGMFAGESFELRNRYSKGIQRIPRMIESLQKPVVAMVNGAAIGAGCDLVAMCDLRICSDKAKFGETFTKLGLVPGDGGPYFLARSIGYAKAMEMYLTGKIYDSAEALHMGLVSSVVKHDELVSQTRELAQMIAANAPAAVQFTKTAMKRAMKDDLDSHLNMMSAYQGIAQRTHDHFEAIDAFMEKRPSEFEGK
jgi:enoyl-CoA hydratase/carnithine racemase